MEETCNERDWPHGPNVPIGWIQEEEVVNDFGNSVVRDNQHSHFEYLKNTNVRKGLCVNKRGEEGEGRGREEGEEGEEEK